MKRWIILFAILVSTASYGQYNVAVGLRAGETSGLTIKGFTGSGAALEGILGMWSHGFSATLLYEVHTPVFNTDGFNLYYGGGGHVAFFAGDHHWYRYGKRKYHYYDDHDGMGLGIDGVVGLEYKIPKAPIAFSLDLKPYIEFNTRGGTWVSLDPGLGLKVAF